MAQNPNASTVYVGRLSLILPDHASVQIDGADYDGVAISEPSLSAGVIGPAPEKPLAQLMDEQWKLHLEQLDNNYGPGKQVILSRDPVEGQRAVLYRVLPGGRLTSQDSVIRELWTVMDGHVIRLSIRGFNREQPLLLSLLTNVLHAMGPMTGPVGPNVVVAPGCYIHLPPSQGESVDAEIEFGAGYNLTVSTNVLTRPKPQDVKQRLTTGVLPGFAELRQIISGTARAGSLDGDQAAVRIKVNDTTGYIAEFAFGGTETGDPLRPTIALRLTADGRKTSIDDVTFLNTWRAVLAGLSVRGPRVP